MKTTVVEELFGELEELSDMYDLHKLETINSIIKEFLEKEKEQLKLFYNLGKENVLDFENNYKALFDK